jgi:tRNA uridine 5-carboxymethylaminomethyl modification enzyme
VKEAALSAARNLLDGLKMSPSEAARHGLRLNQDGIRRSAFDLLAFPDIDALALQKVWPELAAVDARTMAQIEIDAKYAVYLDRQAADIAAFRRDESLAIPIDLDYGSLSGLSNEAKAKLESVRPGTMGQASRIEGMTPAALTLLASQVRRSAL